MPEEISKWLNDTDQLLGGIMDSKGINHPEFRDAIASAIEGLVEKSVTVGIDDYQSVSDQIKQWSNILNNHFGIGIVVTNRENVGDGGGVDVVSGIAFKPPRDEWDHSEGSG